MANDIHLGKQRHLNLVWIDDQGNPCPVDGDSTVAVSDAALLAVANVVQNPNGFECDVRPVGPFGDGQVQASADADRGGGVRPVTATVDFSVVQGEAVSAQTTIGDETPIPPGP